MGGGGSKTSLNGLLFMGVFLSVVFSKGTTIPFPENRKNPEIFLKKVFLVFFEKAFFPALSMVLREKWIRKGAFAMCEEMKFKALDKDGKEVTCEVLFTFGSDTTGKDYMVYTDHSEDENGNTKVYASIYDPTDPESDLIPIESEAEWYMVQQIFKEIQKEYERWM